MEKAKEVYRELNKLYSSDHNDQPHEMNNALLELDNILQQGVDPTLLFDKMKQMVEKVHRTSEYKTKLSTVIMNRYWEKNFIEMIPYRQFKID